MKKLLLFPVLLTVILISSCQKEVNETLPPNTTSGDSVISQMIVLDTNFATGADTSQVLKFTYDGSGRVSRTLDTYYNPGVTGPGRIDATDDITYHYAGSSTMPDIISSSYSTPMVPASSVDRSYLSYSNGYISRDSFATTGYYITSNFSRLSTTRYKIYKRVPSPFTPPTSLDSVLVYVEWVGGNPRKEIDSVYTSGLWDVRTTTVTFDNKPNPLKPLALLYYTPWQQDIPSIGSTILAVASTNNVTSINDDSGLYTLRYEYGPTGLPKIGRDSDGLKIFYRYIHL